jgi:hypothetical protein
MRLIHWLVILLASFLSPSQQEVPPADTYRVVTAIQVSVLRDGKLNTFGITDSEQMEKVLTYLRLTDPTPTAQVEPESFRSECYTFTVFFSDGSSNRYQQIYHDYLKKNDARWQRIDPKAFLLFPSL